MLKMTVEEIWRGEEIMANTFAPGYSAPVEETVDYTGYDESLDQEYQETEGFSEHVDKEFALDEEYDAPVTTAALTLVANYHLVY